MHNHPTRLSRIVLRDLFSCEIAHFGLLILRSIHDSVKWKGLSQERNIERADAETGDLEQIARKRDRSRGRRPRMRSVGRYKNQTG